MLVFILLFVDAYGQDISYMSFGSRASDCILSIKADSTYSLSSYDDSTEVEITVSLGTWSSNQNKYKLTDNLSSVKTYSVTRIDKFNIIVANMACFNPGDKLRINRFRNQNEHWSFDGTIILGQMNGVKIDFLNGVREKFIAGQVVERDTIFTFDEKIY